MMRFLQLCLFCLCASVASMASAAVVRFDAISAQDGLIGYFTLESSELNGSSSQFLSNSVLLELSFHDPAHGLAFDTGDINGNAHLLIDGSQASPALVGASGVLAQSGNASIFLFGTSGASISGGSTWYDITWTSHKTPAPIPLPATGLLLGGALGGVAWLRVRRRRSRQTV